MWVRSLALLSGLRIQHCHKLRHRLQLQLRFDPYLGTSVCHRCIPKKEKKKKKKVVSSHNSLSSLELALVILWMNNDLVIAYQFYP